jgi:hypothetical protein
MALQTLEVGARKGCHWNKVRRVSCYAKRRAFNSGFDPLWWLNKAFLFALA